MAELTPEERQRIYEEEKARFDARKQLEEGQKKGGVSCGGMTSACCAIVVVIFLLLFIVGLGSKSGPSSYTPSSNSSDSTPTVPPEQVDALQREFEKQDAAEKSKVVVSDSRTEEDEHYLYVRGSVKNGSALTVRYWKVTAQFFNSKGNIIDTGFTNSTETLLPGASKRFEIMQPMPPGSVRAHSFVEEVDFAN